MLCYYLLFVACNYIMLLVTLLPIVLPVIPTYYYLLLLSLLQHT